MKVTRVPAVIKTIETVVEPESFTLLLTRDETLHLAALLGKVSARCAREVGLEIGALYDALGLSSSYGNPFKAAAVDGGELPTIIFRAREK